MGFQESDDSVAAFLSEALHLAGKELLRRFGSKLDLQTKADRSLVTDADLASEAIILGLIRRYFPSDVVYSEEAGLSSRDRRPGSYIWIIDPLDGTTNYANRYPFYSVSIGRGRFSEDGTIEVVAGGVTDPSRGKTYLAAKGKGAYCNEDRLAVSQLQKLADAFLVTGFYYHRGETLQAEIQRFSRVAQECQTIRRDGSAALDLALVAEGVFDAFWERGLSPWDLAAGTLLIQEAGGAVRNYRLPANGRYDLEGEGVISGALSLVDQIACLI